MRVATYVDTRSYPYGHSDVDVDRVECVLLNGVKLENCVAADDVEGSATVIVCDPDGHSVIENDEAVTEVLHGDVRIILKEEPCQTADADR